MFNNFYLTLNKNVTFFFYDTILLIFSISINYNSIVNGKNILFSTII